MLEIYPLVYERIIFAEGDLVTVEEAVIDP